MLRFVFLNKMLIVIVRFICLIKLKKWIVGQSSGSRPSHVQVADLISFARYITVLTHVKYGLQGLGIFTRRVLICHAGPWVECCSYHKSIHVSYCPSIRTLYPCSRCQCEITLIYKAIGNNTVGISKTAVACVLIHVDRWMMVYGWLGRCRWVNFINCSRKVDLKSPIPFFQTNSCLLTTCSLGKAS